MKNSQKNDALEFTLYVAENYKRKHDLSGSELTELFDKYGVWDYLYECYPALHMASMDYTIADVEGFIKDRLK